MAEEPNGRGLAWLLAAKAACCGALLLAATGALSLGGLANWFLDGGIAWLAGTALVIVMLDLWRQHRAERMTLPETESESRPRRAA